VPEGIELNAEVDVLRPKGLWKAWARSCIAILQSMMGYKLIVERPTVTGTRARGTNGPAESAALAVLSVMVDWMMGLIWVVCSIFELRRRDARYNNQRDG
jgi:hypothetical protein